MSVADIPDKPPIARARVALLAHRAGDPILWLIVTVVFAVYTALAVSRYITGNPTTDDLGIFTEAVKQYAHFNAPVVDLKGVGFNLLGDHFHPLLAALVPLWWIYPSAVTLLVAQAGCAALSVIPVYQAASHRLTRAEARIIAAAYGFSWGLAGLVWYDFHEVALAVPLLALSLSALVRGKADAAMWWALPAVWVKENLGFTVAAIGLILLLQRRWRLGITLVAWGIGWSLLEVYWLIPHFNPQHLYPYWDRGPAAAALAAGAEVKIPTIVLILLPTVFVALRSPLALIAAPSVGLHMISSNSTYWVTDSYHNATVMPIVFCAAVDGLGRIRAARRLAWAKSFEAWLGRHAAPMMAAAAVALVYQSPLPQLWQPSAWRVSADMRAVEAAERLIPDGKVVDSSVSGIDQLASREDLLYWDSRKIPDYVLYDQAPGTWYASTFMPSTASAWFAKARYQTVFRDEHVWLLKRVG